MFKSAGFRIYEGKHSVRLEEFDRFGFHDLLDGKQGGSIEADNHSAYVLANFSERVSNVFAQNDIRHRFEVYTPGGQMSHYFHFDWPL
nr:hypothetical protein [Roseovarius sp. W115]